MTETIITTKINNLLHIQFNRPLKQNAINFDMYDALNKALDQASDDHTINVVLISSTSDHFTSGNDLKDFMNVKDDIEKSPIVKFINKIAGFKKPIVAGVKGNAIGIGTTLLLHCDIVFADSSAIFSTPFTKLGLVPEAGSSYLLPKRIGTFHANNMLLLGEAYGAMQAEDIGLITRLYKGDDFDGFILGKAKQLAKMPQNAILETKALLAKNNPQLRQRMTEEVEKFNHLLKQEEFTNIIKAFFKK